MTDKINIVAGLYDAFAYESLSITNVATGLTVATFRTNTGTAQRAICTIETTGVRYRYDGTDPTASEGHLLLSSDVLVVSGRDNLNAIKFIQTGTATATIKITYEK